MNERTKERLINLGITFVCGVFALIFIFLAVLLFEVAT